MQDYKYKAGARTSRVCHAQDPSNSLVYAFPSPTQDEKTYRVVIVPVGSREIGFDTSGILKLYTNVWAVRISIF